MISKLERKKATARRTELELIAKESMKLWRSGDFDSIQNYRLSCREKTLWLKMLP